MPPESRDNARDGHTSPKSTKTQQMDSLIALEEEPSCSIASAFEKAKAQQSTLGFGLSLLTHYSNRQGRQRNTYFCCDRGGKRRNKANNTKCYQTTSRKLNCGFRGVIRYSDFDGKYYIKYFDPSHNHAPVSAPRSSAAIRRHSRQVFGEERLRKKVEELSNLGTQSSNAIANTIELQYPELSWRSEAISEPIKVLIASSWRCSRAAAREEVREAAVMVDALPRLLLVTWLTELLGAGEGRFAPGASQCSRRGRRRRRAVVNQPAAAANRARVRP